MPYGKDLYAADRIHATRTTEGGQSLALACYRRLITRRGSLLYAPTYGMCISDLINAESTTDDIAKIPGKIRQELLKDKRIASVFVTTSLEDSAPFYRLVVDIEGVAVDSTTFALVLSVDSVTVQVLKAGGV